MQQSRLDALLLRVPCWRGVVALTYHRIGDGSSSDLYPGVWSATADGLDRQLKLIKRHFDLIDPHRLTPELLAMRGRGVIVTFDDGYRDVYEVARPVLDANGVRAVMFLCSGFIDGVATAWWDEIAWMLRRSTVDELAPGPWSDSPLALRDERLPEVIDVVTGAYWALEDGAGEPFLERLGQATGAGRRPPAPDDWITWEMARALKSAGHVIGGHTVTHPILSRSPPVRQREEIVRSLDRIEAETGERPRLFAYPVGTRAAINESARQSARDAGIELAFSNYRGHVTARNFSAFDVRRIPAEILRVRSILSATLALPQVFARPYRP
jgi:peptidoglycan/xylan/chitin deacetylase (PgdA/CDA1 family)